MIKSFSGQVVFCFAFLRAMSAYVGENWLSQYNFYDSSYKRCIIKQSGNTYEFILSEAKWFRLTTFLKHDISWFSMIKVKLMKAFVL